MGSGAVNSTSKEEEEKARLLYLSGLTCQQVAEELNIRFGAVSRIIKDFGISRSKNGIWRKYHINESYFEKIDTEEKAYFLGLLYADGNVEKNSNSVSLGLQFKDKDLVERFVRAVVLNPEDFKIYKKRVLHVAVIKSAIFKQNLIKAGCVPNKSLILECPTEEVVPNNLFHHFIRGVFDGDGCACIWKPKDKNKLYFRAEFISGSKLFMNEVCKRLKLISPLAPNLCKRNGKNPIYRVAFLSKDNQINFYKFLYKDATIFFSRKREKFEQFFNSKI